MSQMFYSLITSLSAHPYAWTMGAFYVFSNAVAAWPTPAADNSTFYHWAWGFSHMLAGNIAKIIAARYPSAVMASSAVAGK